MYKRITRKTERADQVPQKPCESSAALYRSTPAPQQRARTRPARGTRCEPRWWESGRDENGMGNARCESGIGRTPRTTLHSFFISLVSPEITFPQGPRAPRGRRSSDGYTKWNSTDWSRMRRGRASSKLASRGVAAPAQRPELGWLQLRLASCATRSRNYREKTPVRLPLRRDTDPLQEDR